MVQNLLARYGQGYVDPRLQADSADYNTLDVLSMMPSRQPFANALSLDNRLDRDAILPFAQSPGQRTPPSQWTSTADVMRNADATRGGAWQLALPQFAVDAVKAVDAVGSSGLMTPYTRTDEAREAMTEHAGAIVGPQMAAGFMRNALARPGVSELGSAGGRLPPDAPGIRAYHGSPHDFDRFSLDKIGTGEGAQAYGHGLYFAEREATANHYRYGVGPTTDDGKLAASLLQEAGGNKQKAMALVKDRVPMTNLEETTRALRIIEHLHGAPSGRMYEVRINADPDQFLDWDKPLSQQSEKVRSAIGYDLSPEASAKAERLSKQLEDTYARLGASPDRRPVDPLLIRQAEMLEKQLEAIDPKGFAKMRVDNIGGDPAASRRLREAGIPGIKYLDQGSRTAGEGSRNYVVFDDSLISILRKYGLLPPAVAGVAAASQSDQDRQ